MKLTFENVGKVAKAEIEVESITVIAGANDTGKSTVGKILYSIYTALNELTPEKLLENKVKSIRNDEEKIMHLLDLEESLFDDPEVIEFVESGRYFALEEGDVKLFNNHKSKSFENLFNANIKDWVEMLKTALKDKELKWGKKQIEAIFQDMLIKADTKSDSKIIQLLSIQDVVLSEFSGSLTTELCESAPAKIVLEEEDGHRMEFEFLANEIDDTTSRIEKIKAYAQPLYIDNPFILDELNKRKRSAEGDSYSNKNKLINLIEQQPKLNAFEKVLESKKLRTLFDSVIEGRIIKTGWRYQYKTKKMRNPVDIESLSTGMKSFAILKMLFDSQKLDKCELLILDEPEVHLHPEWQLKYAELAVLLASERHMKVLITSHSPYFIQAIELYSKKYKLNQFVHYYRAENKTNEMSEIVDMTARLEELYEDMALPLRFLTEMREELADEE